MKPYTKRRLYLLAERVVAGTITALITLMIMHC